MPTASTTTWRSRRSRATSGLPTRRRSTSFAHDADRLSFAVHGNDHTSRELTAPESAVEADEVLAQALRRVAAFEQASGVQVSRVMVPPHGRCSDLVLTEMARAGFEAVTFALPRTPAFATAGLDLAEVGDARMPVLVRRKLACSDDLILRLFLDQPAVSYGHQADLANGLGALEDVAATVNRIPGARWCDLGELARSNYLSRRSGTELAIRPFARRLHVRVEPGVTAVVVEALGSVAGEAAPAPREHELGARLGGQVTIPDSGRSVILVEPVDGEAALDIRFESERMLDPDAVPPPRFSIAPSLRRWATEARDRSHPFRARLLNGRPSPAERR